MSDFYDELNRKTAIGLGVRKLLSEPLDYSNPGNKPASDSVPVESERKTIDYTKHDGSKHFYAENYGVTVGGDPVPLRSVALPERPKQYTTLDIENHFSVLEQLLTLARKHEQEQFETIKTNNQIITAALEKLEVAKDLLTRLRNSREFKLYIGEDSSYGKELIKFLE